MPEPTRTRRFGRKTVRNKDKYGEGKQFIPGAKRITSLRDADNRLMQVFERRKEGIAVWYLYEPATQHIHVVATADDNGADAEVEEIHVNSSREGGYGLLMRAISRRGISVKRGPQ